MDLRGSAGVALIATGGLRALLKNVAVTHTDVANAPRFLVVRHLLSDDVGSAHDDPEAGSEGGPYPRVGESPWRSRQKL